MAQQMGSNSEAAAPNQPLELQYSVRMLIQFFALAFVLTWAFMIPSQGLVSEAWETPLIIVAAFGPMLAAAIIIGTHLGRAALGRWLRQTLSLRLPLGHYLAGALVLPIGVGLFQFGLYRLFGGAPDWASAERWFMYPFYLIPTMLLTGGNEEPGWRGFALPGLLQRFSPIIATLILGFFHAAWHLPMLRHYQTNFAWYLFDVIPLTVVFNWIYLKSRRSVIPVALFHAGTNVIERFMPTPGPVLGLADSYTLLRGLVYWAMALVIVLATRGSLGYRSASAAEADMGASR